MQVRRDYYEVLGVSRDATDQDIRKAFRRLAFQCHPDRNHEAGAEDKFKEINEAYQCLCDPQKRRTYDLYGQQGADGASFGDFGFGGLGEIFETFFGAAFGEGHSNAPVQGQSFRLSTTLTFEEAASGCVREVTVNRTETCPDCRGTGCEAGTSPLRCSECGGSGRVRRMQQSVFGRFSHVVRCARCGGAGTIIARPCPSCKGKTTVTATRRLHVDIPPGVDTGSTVTLRGQGSVGVNDGRAGDVLIAVEVQPHEFFSRSGLDIHYELPVNFAQAALGADVEVPVLGGTSRIHVPANTQTGEVLRLKGKGIQERGGRKHGDQLLHVKVTTPRKLTKEQRRLFEELARTLPAD
jgi:molecular chaperone DnaJ